MRFAAALVVALAGIAVAKPVFRPPVRTTDGPELAARMVEAIRQHDVAGVQAQLADVVSYDGLWFADAACAKRFGKTGVAEKAEVKLLAQCLAQARPIATTRRAARPGGAILTFDPGIELEAQFQGERLIWIGASWARDTDRGRPTLTVQAFEALRTAGTTRLDAAVAPKLAGVSQAWIKICLDAGGAIESTFVLDARPVEAGNVFVAAIADWKFRPFEHRRTKLAACSLALFSYPADTAPMIETVPQSTQGASPRTNVTDLDSPYELELDGVSISRGPQTVPPTTLESYRLKGTLKIEPDPVTRTAIAKAGKTTVIASLKMCVDATGRVMGVAVIRSSGYADYDAKLEREMRTWAFKPYLVNGAPVSVCTAETFVYRAKP